MSYSITGIQTNSADYSFPTTQYASGGSIHPSLTPTTVDHDATKAATQHAATGTTPDKFKVASTQHTAPPTATATAAPVDTVTLSTVDKVRNLREQGEGDTLIATTLNLPIKEVDSDLHVSTQTPQHLSFTVAPVISPLSTSAPASTGHTVSADA